MGRHFMKKTTILLSLFLGSVISINASASTPKQLHKKMTAFKCIYHNEKNSSLNYCSPKGSWDIKTQHKTNKAKCTMLSHVKHSKKNSCSLLL